MSEITQAIGVRLRQYRLKAGLSQEKLAERAVLHPTYIGQIERGEKNLTIDSLLRITQALSLPLSQLFEHIGGENDGGPPSQIYDLAASLPAREQELLLGIVRDICRLRGEK